MKIRISDCERETEIQKQRGQAESERGRKEERVGKRKEGNTVAKGYNPGQEWNHSL